MAIIDYAVLVAYFVVLAVVAYFSIKRIDTSADYAVAGHRIAWPILFAAIAASFFGAGSALGRSGGAFEDGIVLPLAASAAGIQLLLTGYFVAPAAQKVRGRADGRRCHGSILLCRLAAAYRGFFQ